MSYAETILPEFDQEMGNTRKVLERVPEDKWDWKAHPKSNTIGWNANHLAEIPGWVEVTLKQTEWDFAPPGGEPYQTPTLRTREEVLSVFDQNVAAGRKAISEAKDEEMNQTWTLLFGGTPIYSAPRSATMRSFILNHLIHHRAILCVYLRLNDVPVPGLYGPSGDETGD